MELRHLRYFLKAAELQNFTLASAQLHITQPTLSHQIHQLEAELGVRLFIRVGRNVRLTAEGSAYLAHANRVLREVELGQSALYDLQDLKIGQLNIGVLSSFGTFSLPPILADFHTSHPGVKISVSRLRSRDIEDGLLNGKLDFGVANTPVISDQICAEPLLSDPLALIVGNHHALAKRQSIHLTELSQHKLILLTREYGARHLIEMAFTASNLTPVIAMEMSAIEPILATVRLSPLATILSANLARRWMGLRSIALTPEISRTVALFTRRGGHLSPASVAFAQAIRRSLDGVDE